MNWVLFAITSVFFNSLATILQKSHATKKLNHTVISGSLYQIVSGITIFVFAFLTSQIALKYTQKSLLLTVIALSFFVVGTWAYFKAMYLINASVLTVILTLRAVITTIIAVIFLGETIHINQLVGMILILSAILIMQNFKKIKLNLEGTLLGVLASFIFGIGNVLERVILKEMNLYLYIVPAFIVPGVLLFIYQTSRLNGKKITLTKVTTGHILTVGTISALSGILSMYAIIQAPSAGHFAFVSQTRVIMVAIFAYIFLQERGNTKKRIFAAFLCTLGLLLLA